MDTRSARRMGQQRKRRRRAKNACSTTRRCQWWCWSFYRLQFNASRRRDRAKIPTNDDVFDDSPHAHTARARERRRKSRIPFAAEISLNHWAAERGDLNATAAEDFSAPRNKGNRGPENSLYIQKSQRISFLRFQSVPVRKPWTAEEEVTGNGVRLQRLESYSSPACKCKVY